jgi:hypothetical protein
MATNILGFSISMPIMIAPSAMQKMAHPDGSDECSVIRVFYSFSKEKFSWRNLSGMQESLPRQELQLPQEQ